VLAVVSLVLGALSVVVFLGAILQESRGVLGIGNAIDALFFILFIVVPGTLIGIVCAACSLCWGRRSRIPALLALLLNLSPWLYVAGLAAFS
jgi:hypothetical protein